MTTTNKMKCCLCFLAHGNGMAELFSNSVRSLRKHCPDLDVFLYVSAESAPAYQQACTDFNVSLRPITVRPAAGQQDYAEYGSVMFNHVTTYKFVAMREQLQAGYAVVAYADMDIVFLGDFRPMLIRASAIYSIGMQSSSERQFPLRCCLGVMYFTKRAIPVLNQLEALVIKLSDKMNDEEVFNEAYKTNPELIREVFVLPEALFPTGNNYAAMLDTAPFETVSKTKPLLFHANYVVGLEAKIDLLKHVGMWDP